MKIMRFLLVLLVLIFGLPPLDPVRAAQAVAPAKLAQIAAAENQAAPNPLPIRTEISRYERWFVTCDEFTEPAPKKICHADLQITKAETGQVILSWAIVPAQGNDLNVLLQVPTGVSIANGIEIFTDDQSVKKFPFVTCEPGRCTGSFPLTVVLAKDLASASVAKVVVISTNGSRVEISQSLKGLDRAAAATRGSFAKR
jgi:invasion protein IalB